MHSSGLRILLVFFATSAAILAAPSGADARRRRPPVAETPPPTDPAQAAAREHYDRAKVLFDENNFAEALVEFQAAYDARPHPIVLLSIAECFERLERWSEAAQKLDIYLQASPDAPDRADVEARVARIRARPARIHVVSSPEGASIRLDGDDTGQVTPSDVEMAAGEHDLALSLSGYDDASEHLVVEGAESREVSVTLTEALDVEPIGPIEEPDDDGGGSSSAVWIFGGITGVALVGGTVLGFLALSDQAEFDENPSHEVKDRGERMALFADIGFGLALAAGITTIILAAASGGSEEEEDDAEVRLRILPVASRDGAGLSLSGVYR